MNSILSPLQNFGSAFWMTTREAAPYLVLGLALAGILHVMVPHRIILWALGKAGLNGAVRGALLGAPLPLCSCSVLPTALTLRRKGASVSATTSFMISTPETSVDALAITFALLPAVFIGVRPLAALILAIAVGYLVERLTYRSTDSVRDELNRDIMLLRSGNASQKSSPKSNDESMDHICKVCGLMETAEHKHNFASKVRSAFRFAFIEFFEDIGLWIVAGLLFAAVISVALPNDLFRSAWWTAHPNTQIWLAILIGVPLYSCATATTPLVATLLLKGLNPGAGLALLLTGPASNLGTVFALKREYGTRYTTIYYSSLIGVCFVLCWGLNQMWPWISSKPSLMKVASTSASENVMHGMPGWIEVVASWILILLVIRYAWGKFVKKDGCCDDHDHAHHNHAH